MPKRFMQKSFQQPSKNAKSTAKSNTALLCLPTLPNKNRRNPKNNKQTTKRGTRRKSKWN